MPPPYKVDRQADSDSCGYHALANGINALKGKTVTTPQTLIGRPDAPSPVQRIADSQFNERLAVHGLPFKVTRPMKDGQRMPLGEALRSYGPGGVFIALAKADIHDEKTGEMSADYHTVVITDYKSNPDDAKKDTWNVLCSASGSTKVITEEGNFKYNFGAGSNGVRNKSFLLTIEGCQVLEESASAGGFATAKEGGFFKDLFCCCNFFGKSSED